MKGSISLIALQMGLFGFFSVKCALLYLTLRRETAIAWTTGALMLGLVNMIVYALWPSDRVEQLTTILTTPLGFYCVAQAVRLLGRQPPPDRRFWGAIAVLILTEAAMLLAGVPVLTVMALFQLTIVPTPLYSIRRLRQMRARHPLDRPLLVALSVMTAVFAVRWPAWALTMPADATYRMVRELPVDTILLTIGSLNSTLIAMLLVGHSLSDLYVDLRDRSERDALTRLYNRVAFDDRVMQGDGTGALILVDLDQFRALNERYGHAVGDSVLGTTARLLRETGYLCARISGEQFALWLPSASPHSAVELATRLRRMILSRSHPGLAPGHQLTASFGIAWCDPSIGLAESYHRADSAVYRAKAAGRDRIELCPVAHERLAA